MPPELTPREKLIAMARVALTRRENLAGAGQAIMRTYGLDESTARRLHAEEVERRRVQ